MPVSQKQIAVLVGIDPSMVSHALRGDSRVSEATRARVLSAARELGYHNGLNREARSLAARRHGKRLETRTISMVFDVIEVEDNWGAPTYRGMRESARERGYDLLTLLRAPENWMLDQQELLFLDRRSDGLVFMVPKERARVLETLVEHRIPAVSCFLDDVPDGVATIVLDNASAMKHATEYLIAHGHQKILFAVTIGERSDFRRRREGYEVVMNQARLQPITIACRDESDNSWLCEVRDLLRRRAVTAIVCGADNHAVAITKLAHEMGLSVPGDLSISGMDDDPEAAAHGLTTFRYSCEDVGRYAVEAVVRMIDGEDYRECNKVLPVQMVERTSVAPPKIQEVRDEQEK